MKWNFSVHPGTNFLYFRKRKPRKKVLIFQEMELSSSKIKKFVIFSQKTAFLVFLEMEQAPKNKKKFAPSKFLLFQEMETPKKFIIFFRRNAFLIFLERETLKKFILFQ